MRKTWQAKCYADYLAIDKEARANDTKWASEIDEASNAKGPYGRIGAMLGLVETAEKTSQGGSSYIDSLMSQVGYRQDLRVALKQAYESVGRDYLYAIEGRAQRGGDIRARLDAATERDMYCRFALGNGTPKTPELTGGGRGSSYTEKGARFVKPLFTEERRMQLERLWHEEANKSLEEGVSIQVGDKVEGYTIVEKHEEKTVTDTKPLVKKTELRVLELSHLTKLTRKGKAVGKWF